MKSKYIYEKMELDGDIVAVPVGDNADEFHAVIYVNEEAMRILELLQKETTVQEIVSKLLSEYESTEDEIFPLVSSFIDQMRQENLLDE